MRFRFPQFLPRRLLLVLAAVACSEQRSTTLPRLPNDRAGDVVKRAIEFAVGWEKWLNVRTVDYLKTTIRFDDDGNVARTLAQKH